LDKPTLAEVMSVTQSWWSSINPEKELEIPVMRVRRFLVLKKLCPDVDAAGKDIVKQNGQVEMIDYPNFYKLFSRGIFRLMLQNMLQFVEMVSQLQGTSELDFQPKLDAFLRTMMINGIGREWNELKDRGLYMLSSLGVFLKKCQPNQLSTDYQAYANDPFKVEQKQKEKLDNESSIDAFNKHIQYTDARKKAQELDIDVEEIEKRIVAEQKQLSRENKSEPQEHTKVKVKLSGKKLLSMNIKTG
jgi:hypothetical protein